VSSTIDLVLFALDAALVAFESLCGVLAQLEAVGGLQEEVLGVVSSVLLTSTEVAEERSFKSLLCLSIKVICFLGKM